MSVFLKMLPLALNSGRLGLDGQVDPVPASVPMIPDFLLHLLGVHRLSPGTVRGYCSVITNVLSYHHGLVWPAVCRSSLGLLLLSSLGSSPVTCLESRLVFESRMRAPYEGFVMACPSQDSL